MNAVTREELFFRSAPDDSSALLAVRPGRPVRAALEQSHMLVNSVQRSLKELAKQQDDVSSSDSLGGTLWSLSYVLETVEAALHASLSKSE